LFESPEEDDQQPTTRRTNYVQFTVVDSSQIYVNVCLSNTTGVKVNTFLLPFTIITDHPSVNPKAKELLKLIFLFVKSNFSVVKEEG